ncbi:MAG: hypothetical protein ABI306_08700 [Caulobacteraceae bacterium]
MFGREKRASAEQLARDLAAGILDPEACRTAAARLSNRPTPDPVGSCEMAFAGAATLKHVIDETQPPAIAARMNGVMDAAVAEAFGGVHTAETLDHYGPESLPVAAAAAVERYRGDAFWSKRVAETMAARLEIPGPPSMAVAQVFSEITERAVLAISRVRIE